MEFISMLKEQDGFIGGNGSPPYEIENAEKILHLRFASDYRTYLLSYGIVAFGGHELTGICKSKRVNVVDVTEDERKSNPAIPSNWYVIEQANIDGIVIWQNDAGEVFQTMPNRKPQKIANSFSEYIMLFQ